MSTPYIPTEAEHDLLNTARQVLGGNLFEFLLSGLGEPHYSRRRFTATSIREHGLGVTYQFEAVAESERGLPGGRDPVVMAALMHLLWIGRSGTEEIVFREEELLGLLSWPDTRKSTILHFTTKLVEEVSGKEKYFLGIDFERLEGLRLL